MIQLSSDDRRKRDELKRELRALERPAKEAQRAERKANTRAKPKREQRITHDTGKQDRGREVDKVYRGWIRQLPCVAGLAQSGGCCGMIEAAHLRFSDAAAGRTNPGVGRKSDDLWVTPLCHHHHQGDQHTRSERAFWADLGIDVNALCRDLRAAYPDTQAAVAILRQHARRT